MGKVKVLLIWAAVEITIIYSKLKVSIIKYARALFVGLFCLAQYLTDDPGLFF